MENLINLKRKALLLILFVLISIFSYPINTFAANPNISIETNSEDIVVGNEISITYKLNTADFTIMSLDLTFSYDKAKLDFIDADLTQAGSQIDTSSSALTTITKKLADEQVGELKISGTKIGGLTGNIILFVAKFKALEAGETSLNTDATISKLLDNEGVITFDSPSKVITISPADGGSNGNSSVNTPEPDGENESLITFNHSPILQGPSNEALLIDIVLDPISEIKEARIYFQNTIDTSFTRVKMSNLDGNNFRGVIPQDKIIIGEIKYFFGVIDTKEGTHRYPKEEDQFFSTNIVMNQDPPTGLTDDNNNQQPIDNINPTNPVAYNDYNYNSTTATGPEEVYILIIGLMLVMFYAFYSESRKSI